MRDCFEAGHANPACRPTADDWHRALDEAEAEWNEIGARLRYCYYRMLRPRGWAQNFVAIPERIRAVVTCVPRKAWATAAGLLIVVLLGIAAVRWWSEPSRPGETNRPTSSWFQREVDGEETPWLWKEAQRRNRARR
jgi:hypothetical protein